MNELERLDRACRGLPPAFATIAEVMRQAQAFAQAFERAYRAAIEQAYLRTHRRLPGSPRTRRWRKKRLARLMAWEQGEYREGSHG
jgi:hypothetical protein